LTSRMVAVSANKKRAALLSQRSLLLEWRAELHKPGAHAAQLPPDESADRPRAIRRRARCDCSFRDAPMRWACRRSGAHLENPFSQGAAHMGAGRAEWSRRR